VIISDFSVKRPVFAAVISLLLVILGIMSFTRLSVREYPAIDPPVVSVDVDYRGASAEVVETRITQVIEDALPVSRASSSSDITERGRAVQHQRIEFSADRDIDAATNDVRDRVSARRRRQLPVGGGSAGGRQGRFRCRAGHVAEPHPAAA
jgi:multidrug efflux pump